MHWSPWDHVRPARQIRDFGTAAATLREVVSNTAPLLVREEQDVIVRLSGGLDSSIVAAALAAAGRHFRAVTFATSAPDGDERHYARQVAAFLSIELAELLEEQGPIDFGRRPACALRPPPNALLQPLHAALSEHLASTRTDLVLDGAGGDNVFCYLNTASPALDAAGRGRVGAAFRTLHHLAALHGTTFWKVARAAARRSRRRSERWRRDVSFLAPGAATEQAEDHPWLRRPARVPAGTYEQLQSIIGIRHFLPDPDPEGPANLHPLLTQPLIETCLRIPSWLWIDGGRDRSVARAAFADLLPAPILARRSKGRLESMFMRGYMDGRKQIEPLLLDGRLNEAGLLDREAIARYLRRPEQPRDAGYIRLLELSSAETWLRSFGS
jgi:asparagine synthase (glutamine-hydrolysing)